MPGRGKKAQALEKVREKQCGEYKAKYLQYDAREEDATTAAKNAASRVEKRTDEVKTINRAIRSTKTSISKTEQKIIEDRKKYAKQMKANRLKIAGLKDDIKDMEKDISELRDERVGVGRNIKRAKKDETAAKMDVNKYEGLKEKLRKPRGCATPTRQTAPIKTVLVSPGKQTRKSLAP